MLRFIIIQIIINNYSNPIEIIPSRLKKPFPTIFNYAFSFYRHFVNHLLSFFSYRYTLIHSKQPFDKFHRIKISAFVRFAKRLTRSLLLYI